MSYIKNILVGTGFGIRVFELGLRFKTIRPGVEYLVPGFS